MTEITSGLYETYYKNSKVSPVKPSQATKISC